MPTTEAASRAYAELHAYSNFTFLAGASQPEDLVERAAELGLRAIALTDRDGLYGAVRFATHARSCGVQAILGSELTFDDGSRVVVLVEDAHGYANLCELISLAQLRGKKGEPRACVADLDGRCEGLVALLGGEHATRERASLLRERFQARLFIELQRHLIEGEGRRNAALAAMAHALHLPLVATNGVVYARREDALLGDVLACVKEGTTLEAARDAQRLRANAEYHLKPARAMRRLFEEYPRAVDATLEIAARCTFRLERLRGQFPLFAVPQGMTQQSYLRELVERGATERYGTPLRSQVERQLEYELGIIAKTDLAGYFLIVWDIVRAAQRLGVLCQGRGSAANSAVCYVLGITAVDPIGMDLLFERFMSEERREIPDIDIDFAHQDRERVIQYVYERYGRANAAMAAEAITYHTRSALRDVAKAFGASPAEVDALARTYASGEALPEPIASICDRLRTFPRHMGIHSGGMVLTRDPLVRVAPVEWATMRDRTIVQWDKDDLQDLGLIKIDLLGLGMLSLLREAFAIHARCVGGARYARDDTSGGARDGRPLMLHTIPQGDRATYAMIAKADTIGVFQIESRAQQSMLPRMKPACFYDLVMQVAIIRPGPIQGQMVHPFLRRRAGLERVTYPHPKLEPVLKRTLGVPLFQEQGMRIAIEAAGFTPGEADVLRRAMGHKRSRERMEHLHERLVSGMEANGIDSEAGERLYAMLQGFADYGFPESHAASFALLAYASAYIKCHFPAIFAAAILNVQPMGFYSTEVLVNDAKRHGVEVKGVEVNASEYWSHVDEGGALRLGFHVVRGLGEVQRKRLERALRDGVFTDIVDFARRTSLEKEAMESCAIAGAFSPWYVSRREAMWALRALDERESRGGLGRLMDVEEPAVSFAALEPKARTAFDLWSTGVTPQGQIVQHFRVELERLRVIPAARLAAMPNHLVCRVGGLVITRQQPGTAKGFVFLTLEDETGLANVIVRPDVYERHRSIVHTSEMVVIEGKLQKEGGCIDVLARRLWDFESDGAVRGVKAHHFG
ncbi:MAG: error-prone DNA polymerase [Candidatus Tyrphobacter sp.]